MARKTRKVQKTPKATESIVTDTAAPQRPFGRLEGELSVWCAQQAEAIGAQGRASSVTWAKNHVLYDEELAAQLIRRVHVRVRSKVVAARPSTGPVVAASLASPVPAPAASRMHAPSGPTPSAAPVPRRRARPPLPFGVWLTSSAVLALLRWLLPSP
jgi:hypothetical protein